jgi:hypothetical protein
MKYKVYKKEKEGKRGRPCEEYRKGRRKGEVPSRDHIKFLVSGG